LETVVAKQSSSILFHLSVHRTIEILQTFESAFHRLVRGMNVLLAHRYRTMPSDPHYRESIHASFTQAREHGVSILRILLMLYAD
jgi:hypothetical protein